VKNAEFTHRIYLLYKTTAHLRPILYKQLKQQISKLECSKEIQTAAIKHVIDTVLILHDAFSEGYWGWTTDVIGVTSIPSGVNWQGEW